MKALVERRAPEQETIDAKETAVPVVPKIPNKREDCDLHDLARRCGELLAQRTAAECPPSNWLG
jgi:hypothetical protein